MLTRYLHRPAGHLRAFTLMELTAVVTVLLILGTIALVLATRAEQTTIRNNLDTALRQVEDVAQSRAAARFSTDPTAYLDDAVADVAPTLAKLDENSPAPQLHANVEAHPTTGWPAGTVAIVWTRITGDQKCRLLHVAETEKRGDIVDCDLDETP